METETIINLITQYAPSVLAVVMIVLTTVMQKSNLFNGLKDLKERAEELRVASEFKEVQNKMQTLTIMISEQQRTINDLTAALYKVQSKKDD